MSTEFDHYVTTHARSHSQFRTGIQRTFKAGSVRVDGCALVLTNAEETGSGYRGPYESHFDLIIVPLDTIDLALVDIRERPEQ